MKKIFNIKGMHCRSCEILIENEVKKISGVKTVHASNKKGTLLVASGQDVSEEVSLAVQRAGYEVDSGEIPLINKNKKSFLELLGAFVLVSFLIIIFKSFDFGSLLNPASFASSSLAAIFTIGLTAGVSSCMALVGGLVLGISARHAEKHSNATPLQRFRPHLFFNFGRIVSFFLLGGLIGEIGSFFRFSGPVLGIMIMIVAIVMFFLGIQLMEISPKLSTLTLPKFLAGFQKKKDQEYSHRNSLLLGALTFFLPCGFTQATQIYAMSTGSFTRGAFVMVFFALGTTPGLLGIGGLTAAIKRGAFSRIFFKAVGISIIILSFYNLKNGLNLSGLKLLEKSKKAPEAVEETKNWGPKPNNIEFNSEQNNEVQVIKAVYNPKDEGSQYVIEPREFTVKVGQPVRFEVLAQKDGLGCMGSITLPGLSNNFYVFTTGETVRFDFTPKKVRKYQITCGMGIPMGTINVIE